MEHYNSAYTVIFYLQVSSLSAAKLIERRQNYVLGYVSSALFQK